MTKKKVAKKVTKKQVEIKPLAEVAEVEPTFDLSQYGAEDETVEDILFPRIIPINPTSKFVLEGTAQFGQVITDDGVVLCEAGDSFDIIPLLITKTYMVSHKIEGQWKFHAIEAFNGIRPWEESHSDGTHVKNELMYNVYCLVNGESDLPHILTFKGMSIRQGKQLYTLMYRRNVMIGLPPFGKSVTITPVKTSNDKGNFMVMEIKAGDKVKGPVLAFADKCFMSLKKALPTLADKMNRQEEVEDDEDFVQV